MAIEQSCGAHSRRCSDAYETRKTWCRRRQACDEQSRSPAESAGVHRFQRRFRKAAVRLGRVMRLKDDYRGLHGASPAYVSRSLSVFRHRAHRRSRSSPCAARPVTWRGPSTRSTLTSGPKTHGAPNRRALAATDRIGLSSRVHAAADDPEKPDEPAGRKRRLVGPQLKHAIDDARARQARPLSGKFGHAPADNYGRSIARPLATTGTVAFGR
jgi:hypothetical protein